MPRPKLIRQSKYPYHVTSRTNNKVPFPLPLYHVWDIAKQALIYARERVDVEVNCFVLMNNHYHLLITTPDENIDKFMMLFNHRLSKSIAKYSKVINHKFSNRYKWSIVQDNNYLQNVYRYIYQNPLRAGIVDRCISYPYSSLHFTNFEGRLINFKPHFRYTDEVSFYEKQFCSNASNIMKRSLKRSYFNIPNGISSHERKVLES